MAARIESRVIEGNSELISSEERKSLRASAERKGADMTIFVETKSSRLVRGVGRSSRQAKELEIAMGGKENFVEYCQKMLLVTVSEKRRGEAQGFVEAYVASHTKEGCLRFSKKKELLKNRLEAIIAATHSVLELSTKDDEKAFKYMQSGELGISVRESVLRGWEKTKKVLVPLNREVPRLKNKTIRTLPVGGLKKIVEYWLD